MSEIAIKSPILAENNRIADHVRQRLNLHVITCFNLIGSPGSGKTALLEATLSQLSGTIACGVIEGDVKTDHDMRRIARLGVPAHQIETMGSCHLTARMIEESLSRFDLDSLDVMIIENVGNLICPVAYQLGENVRMVVVSITEGADKPLKYPAAFVSADCAIITKIDLEPYIDVTAKELEKNILTINPRLTVIKTSVRNGTGIDTLAHLFTKRGAIVSGTHITR